jgi:hypothetical protein
MMLKSQKGKLGENRMEEEYILKELSNEIIADMNSWNKANPNATFLEIEVKARELVSKLEVGLIQKSAQTHETDNWPKNGEGARPVCPNCKISLVSRGKRVRSLQGTAGREIKLKRTYGTCPNCGTGFSPLG